MQLIPIDKLKALPVYRKYTTQECKTTPHGLPATLLRALCSRREACCKLEKQGNSVGINMLALKRRLNDYPRQFHFDP